MWNTADLLAEGEQTDSIKNESGIANLRHKAAGGLVARVNTYHEEYSQGDILPVAELPIITNIFNYFVIKFPNQLEEVLSTQATFGTPDKIGLDSGWVKESIYLIKSKNINSLNTELEITYTDNLAIQDVGDYCELDPIESFTASNAIIEGYSYPVINNKFKPDIFYSAGTQISVSGTQEINNLALSGRVIGLKITENSDFIDRIDFLGISFTPAINIYAPKQGEFLSHENKKEVFLFTSYVKSFCLNTESLELLNRTSGQYVSYL